MRILPRVLSRVLGRPDGYVALADSGASPATLARYMEAVTGRKPAPSPVPPRIGKSIASA